MKTMRVNTKRLFSSLLSLMMVVNMVPPELTFAAETDGSGLCPHHTEHTEDCSYMAPTEEQPCTHEHTEECYTGETSCAHVHNESCYSDGSIPAGGEEKEADACTHDCAGDSGCVPRVLDCHHVHEEACGYAGANLGHPCEYVCAECSGQDTVDTLPDEEESGEDTVDTPPDTENVEPTESVESEEKVESVKKSIEALPDTETLNNADKEARAAYYDETQTAYDAYIALTAKEQAQIPGADKIFKDLFAVFNSQIMTLEIATAETIQYVDETGATQSVPTDVMVTKVDSTTTTWTAGWYYVPEATTIDGTVNAKGNINLILGGNLTINGSIDAGYGSTLTVYKEADAVSTPKLEVTNGSGSAISFNYGELNAVNTSVTARGSKAGIESTTTSRIKIKHSGDNGEIKISGGQYGILSGGSVFVEGGNVNISSNGDASSKGYAIYAKSFTNNGGNVTVSGGKCAINCIDGGINVKSGTLTFKSSNNSLQLTNGATINPSGGTVSVVLNDKLDSPYSFGGQLNSSEPLEPGTLTKNAYYEVNLFSGYVIYGSDNVLTINNATLSGITATDELTVNLEGENYLGGTVECPLKLTGNGSLTNTGSLDMGSNTLKLSGESSFINNGTFTCSNIIPDESFSGKLINSNRISLTDTNVNTDTIKGLNIDGYGYVYIGETRYDNSGTVKEGLTMSGGLDLSNVTDSTSGDLDNDGYHWDKTSNTLTIENLSIMETLTESGYADCSLLLPAVDERITLKVSGECFIKGTINLAHLDNKKNYSLTITPDGSAAILSVGEVDIASGNEQALTIDGGVTVKAAKIAVGYYGHIRVNGTLDVDTSKLGFNRSSISTGKLTIGASGKLNVSGSQCGIILMGSFDSNDSLADDSRFENAFVIEQDGNSCGTLTANCTDNALSVIGLNSEWNEEELSSLISLPPDVMTESYKIFVGSCTGDGTYGYTITDAFSTDEPIYNGHQNGFTGGLTNLKFDPALNISRSIVALNNDVYNGKPKTINVTIDGTTLNESDFIAKPYDPPKPTVTEGKLDLVNVGTINYKLIATGEYYGVKTGTLEIHKSATEFEGGLNVTSGETDTKNFTYGDTISVTATPKPTGNKAAAGIALTSLDELTEPTTEQMALFYTGDDNVEHQLSEAVTSGMPMTYDTTQKIVPIGDNIPLTVKYIGNSNMADKEDTVDVKISPFALTDSEVTVSEPVDYDGGAHTPDVTVTLGSKAAPAADLGTAYVVSCKRGDAVTTDFTNAGTITVTVAPKDGSQWYTGSVEKTFTINKADPGKVTSVEGTFDTDGTGLDKWESDATSDKGVEGKLTLNNPSTITPDYGNAASYSCTFTPNDTENYNIKNDCNVNITFEKDLIASLEVEGTIKKEYTSGESFNLDGLTINGIRKSGRKKEITDHTKIHVTPETLSLTDTSVTLTYTEADAVSGGATCTVNGIKVSSITDGKYTFELIPAGRYVYTGSAIKPGVKVTYDGKLTLTEGTDYTVVGYENNVNAGTAAVIVKGKENGNYTFEQKIDFTIDRKPLEPSAIKIDINENGYDYTGEAIEPTVTVKDDTKVLAPSTDGNDAAGEYIVSYAYNVNANVDAKGNPIVDAAEQATVTVKDNGKGNYIIPDAAATFKIKPVSPENLDEYKNTRGQLETIHIITNLYPNLAALEEKWLVNGKPLKNTGWSFDYNDDEKEKLLHGDNNNKYPTFSMVYQPLTDGNPETPDKNYFPITEAHQFPVTELNILIGDGKLDMVSLHVDTKSMSSALEITGAPIPEEENNPLSTSNLKWESDPKDIVEVTVLEDELGKKDNTQAKISAVGKGVTMIGVYFAGQEEPLGYVLVQVTSSDGAASNNNASDIKDISQKLDSVIPKPENDDVIITYDDIQKKSVEAVANEVIELNDNEKANLEAEHVETLDDLVQRVCGVVPDIKKTPPADTSIPHPNNMEEDVQVTGVAIATMKQVSDNNGGAAPEITLNVTPVKPENDTVKMQLSVTLTVNSKDAQPDSPIIFSVPLPAEINPDYFELIHVKKDGTKDKLAHRVDKDKKTVSFNMTSFSDVQFVSTEDPGHQTPVDPPQTPAPAPKPSGGGGGGGGSGVTTYRIIVDETEHGTVKPDSKSAVAGKTVSVTVEPDEGYALESLDVTDTKKSQVKLTTVSGSKYSFVMPARNVTVTASFAPENTAPEASGCDGGGNCPSKAFTDLDTGKWYHEAVDYVLNRKMMNGFGNRLFMPEGELSRAMLVQILYNREGHPRVEEKTGFTDVPSDAWYADAVYWAAAKDIVLGYGKGLFCPDIPITREQLAVILWRYEGSRKSEAETLDFSDAPDISGYAVEALRWAVTNGVVNGHADGRLDPKGTATRAQTAQMLMNLFSK